MDMVKCKEFIEFLDDYVDGALASDVTDTFNHHLAMCPGCVEYIKMYKESIKVTKSLCAHDENQPPPNDVPDELIQAILAARPKT